MQEHLLAKCLQIQIEPTSPAEIMLSQRIPAGPMCQAPYNQCQSKESNPNQFKQGTLLQAHQNQCHTREAKQYQTNPGSKYQCR